MVQRIARPPTLTATVAHSIREGIFRGELRPGEPLREINLSETLDVSRGTVREALRQLQDESLVEVVPHRGAFVTNLTSRMAKEIYTLRALIEPFAVRLAMEANAISQEDVEYLEKLSHRLDELQESHEDTYETVKADVEFHTRICSPSNHELLLNMLKSLQSLTWLYVFNIQLYQAAIYSREPSHCEIFQAIKSGDPRRAEETLRDHINAAGAALLYCMEEAGHSG